MSSLQNTASSIDRLEGVSTSNNNGQREGQKLGRGSGRGLGRGLGSGRGLGRGLGRGVRVGGREGGIMPVCRFFIRGACTNSNCRFRHDVDISESVAIGKASWSSNNHQTGKVWRGEESGQDFSSSMRQRPSKREFDPYKAEAINLAKTAQDFESCLFSCLPGPFYSIDVECVAIGYGHSERQRYPGRIALVNDSAYRDGIRDNDKSNLHDEKQHNNNSNEDDVLLDEMIDLTDYKSLTSLGVVSYMTDLTGLTSKTCSPPSATKSLDEVRDMLREILPPNAVLVGHGIGHDLDWIGLKKGEDFREFFDTTIIFRQRIPRNIGSASKLLRDDARRKMEELETGIEESNIATGTTILMEKEVHTVGVNNSDSFQNSKHDNTGGTNLSNNNSCNVDGHPVSVPESTLDVTRREVEDVRGIEKKEYPEEDNLLPFPTRYRLFSLRHCCIHLLGIDIQKAAHNPVKDARYSLFLFHQYKKSPIEMLRAMRDTLHRTPVTPSYASEHPVVDGVCLSLTGYRHKWAGRLVWNWWNKRKTKWNDYDGDGCYKKFEI